MPALADTALIGVDRGDTAPYDLASGVRRALEDAGSPSCGPRPGDSRVGVFVETEHAGGPSGGHRPGVLGGAVRVVGGGADAAPGPAATRTARALGLEGPTLDAPDALGRARAALAAGSCELAVVAAPRRRTVLVLCRTADAAARYDGPVWSARPLPWQPPGPDAPEPGTGVFTLSAGSPEALTHQLALQAAAVRGLPPHGGRESRARALHRCWTSNRTKSGSAYRFALPVTDLESLAAGLEQATAEGRAGCPAVAFVLPGEGVSPGTSDRLYAESPPYREALDEAREAGAAPASFATQYALGRALAGLGIEPGMLAGAGCGEYAAACLAGAVDLPTAARLAAGDEATAQASFTPPAIPLISGMHGRLLERELTDAAYWRAHRTAPVRWAEAVAELLAERPTHIIELGGSGLEPAGTAATVLPGTDLAQAAATLYRAGLDIVWDALYPPAYRAHDRLPPYAPVAPSGPGTVVAAAVEAIARVCGCPVGEVDADARFYEDLGFDSLMYMALVTELGRRIPDAGELVLRDMLDSLGSVSSLTAYLHDRMSSVAA